MSTTTDAIIEQLKSITLLEAAELVSQIEETFGVNPSFEFRIKYIDHFTFHENKIFCYNIHINFHFIA